MNLTRPASIEPTTATHAGPNLTAAFLSATVSLVAAFAASAAPLPLYNTYRADQGFSNADISFTVVAYFIGTIIALLFLGRLANHLGRRPTSIATMVVLALGAGVMLNVTNITVLTTGRFLMGLGAGLASSSLTAYIVDAAPNTPQWLASVASSQAPMLGLTLGAVGSGALVEYGPWPRTLVYLIAIAVLLVCAALLITGPETGHPSPGALRSLRPQVQLPARTRHLVPVAAAVFLSTWATGAYYQAFVPALTVEQLHTHSPLIFGLVFSCYMAPSVLGAPIGGRLTPATAQRVGMGIYMIGMAGLVAGLSATNLATFIAASIVAGAGQGVAVSGSIRGLLHGSHVQDRSPIFAAIYLLSYSGAAIPSLISGQLTNMFTLFQITLGYAALALLATAATLIAARNPLR